VHARRPWTTAPSTSQPQRPQSRRQEPPATAVVCAASRSPARLASCCRGGAAAAVPLCAGMRWRSVTSVVPSAMRLWHGDCLRRWHAGACRYCGASRCAGSPQGGAVTVRCRPSTRTP